MLYIHAYAFMYVIIYIQGFPEKKTHGCHSVSLHVVKSAQATHIQYTFTQSGSEN